MVEYCTIQRKVVRSFGEVQSYCEKNPIHSYPQFMAVTPNAEFVFVATTTGILKKYYAYTGNLAYDFGNVFGKFCFLKSLKFTGNGKYLFSLNQNGNILRYSIEDNIFHDLGQIGQDCNTELEISNDSKHLFLGSDSRLIVYDIERNKIVRDIELEGVVYSIRLSGKFIYCGTTVHKDNGDFE